ncbi:MAG: hypothetical protein WCP89_02075 [archaeon]
MQITHLILSIVVLASAIPLGLLASYLTKDEKNIFKKAPYFPQILWLVAIAAAIFYTLNIKTALTLTFIFILMFVWYKKK